MELTNELKVRFFALYWGLNVGKKHNKKSTWEILHGNIPSIDYLELRSSSSITEEEIHGLCDLLWGDISYQDLYKLIFHNANAELQVSNAVIDYIRSLGIATDLMGISVDEMVKAGWIKLKA